MNTRRDNHPYNLGEPLWIRPGIFKTDDHRTYVPIAFWRGIVGGWTARIIVVGSADTHGEDVPVGYLTDVMPDFRHEDELFAKSYFTKTGWTLRSIDGGGA